MTNTQRIQANNAELRECIELAENLPNAGSGDVPEVEITLQSKTVTPTKSQQEVTADDGFTGLEKVTVEAIPSKYIVPSGTLVVSANGTYNVASAESMRVEVPIPEGYIQPSGELAITENGTHDVREYASVNINVEASGGGDSDLPAGYRRVDYIQFTSEQVVDTGIICNQNTKLLTQFTRENSAQKYLYGVASSDNKKSVTAYLGGSWRFGNKAATKTVTTINEKLSYTAFVDNTTISTTNHVASISDVNDFETVGSLLIGTCRASSGEVGAAQFVGKIFIFSIWEGEEQVLKLIPVTDGNGVYRFWDMVGQKFHDSITDTPLEGGNR